MNGPRSAAALHGDMALPLLVRHDPATVPDEDRLVETALHWITVARQPGPLLSGWAQCAAAASQRMHPPGDPLRQRAVLADAAIRAGIPARAADGNDQLAAGILGMIGDLGAASSCHRPRHPMDTHRGRSPARAAGADHLRPPRRGRATSRTAQEPAHAATTGAVIRRRRRAHTR